MNLTSNQLLDQIEATWPGLGIYLRNNVLPSINNVAQQAGVSPVGKLAKPDPPQGINIAQAGEFLHVSIVDNNETAKAMRYFVGIDTTPAFSGQMVHDYGASRTKTPHFLPTNNGSSTKYKYYVQAWRQMPGSDPSDPVVYGGKVPTAVQMSGSTNLTLLPSTGSGTGSSNGQSGAVGMGKVQIGQPPAPKRAVNSK
jgi:hypothetical protein